MSDSLGPQWRGLWATSSFGRVGCTVEILIGGGGGARVVDGGSSEMF